MTNTQANDSEPGSISAWDSDGTLKQLLSDAASGMRKTESELTYEIIAENIHKYIEYEELPEYKRRWVRMKQQQIEEQYAKDLANERQKRNTFIHYISSQIHRQIMRGAGMEQLSEWIKEQQPLFENRNDLERYEHILNEPGLYYSSYHKWQQAQSQGRNVAFQLPPTDAEQGDNLDLYNQGDYNY